MWTEGSKERVVVWRVIRMQLAHIRNSQITTLINEKQSNLPSGWEVVSICHIFDKENVMRMQLHSVCYILSTQYVESRKPVTTD